MADNNIELGPEPEALPSTSQSTNSQNNGIFPLVSMPKIVLTRLDLQNLPLPLYSSPSKAIKKPIKRLTVKKSKPLVPKSVPKKIDINVKHDTRLRGKPKKDYKFLAEVGTSPIDTAKLRITTGKVAGIMKKVPKLTPTREEVTVKGMLKKTMLQKRSKIAIPPPKKPKLTLTKPSKTKNVAFKLNKDVSNILPPHLQNEFAAKSKDINFLSRPMDTDASEDEFLYDELIDELVNSPFKKISSTEKTTNITLKPNVGNKPPTIVKGGIVKKSSLPADLKSVASPTTLNSSKLTGSAPIFKSKPTSVESVVKAPATAEAPKASLPMKASPFPISINSSPSKSGPKNQGKKGQKKPTKSAAVVKEDPPPIFDIPKLTNKQTKVPQKPKLGGKSATSIPKPRGRPKIGPKKVTEISPILHIAIEDESDEYTEIETLENIDSESPEIVPNLESDSTKYEDIHEITPANTSGSIKSDTQHSKSKPKKDDDPHLDLLRILTDETDDTVQSEISESKKEDSDDQHSNSAENLKPINITTEESSTPTPEETNHSDSGNPGEEADNSSESQTHEISTVQVSEESTTANPDDLIEPACEIVEEEVPHVRTIYDLMTEVSLQHPSWNLHIIPETNAFCIAQVTKGRLGLPTLKKCIELDPDTYSAKVYIHQYHIKRFDGVYESEEAILALFEEINSIKA